MWAEGQLLVSQRSAPNHDQARRRLLTGLHLGQAVLPQKAACHCHRQQEEEEDQHVDPLHLHSSELEEAPAAGSLLESEERRLRERNYLSHVAAR